MVTPTLPQTGVQAGPAVTVGHDRLAARLRTQIVANRRRQSLVVLGLCALIAAAAGWMYLGVERSLREMRAQGLPALLEAKTKSLEVFIAERRADGERWAQDPLVVEATVDLARGARTGDWERHCASEQLALWRSMFAPLLHSEKIAAVNAVDRDGRILASTLPGICGLSAQPRTTAPALAPVFAGRTQFVRPFAADPRLVAAQPFLGARPLAWVETPVRNADGTIVAALGFATYVDRDFEGILSTARPGDTGEAYAFDETGTLLSDLRDVRGLHRVGLLPDGVERAAFRLKVRDPGQPLAPGIVSERSVAQWPPTQPVALALAAATQRGTPSQGVLLDPYRNYLGVEVIGAWRWLPHEHMGVVAEIGVDEAYAPMRYVQLTLVAMLVLLGLTAGWAAWSTLALARLSDAPAAGRRLGAYRLERPLAEGGMSTVHLARHALLRRPAAIKILKRHMATDEVIARFEREVRLVSELRHPNTIEIYDCGHTPDGLLYYAMEYIDGVTLATLIAHEHMLPLQRMRHIVAQVCAALAGVHAKGLVHRDIKPENIMICEHGGELDFVKLLDFGIVKRIEAEATGDYRDAKRVLTRQVRLLGTPAYMPPERIGNPSCVDARTDVYGVGALIYFLVAGRPPFPGEDEAAVLRAVLAEAPPNLALAVPGVPAALAELVARCLAKAPGDRPETVQPIVSTLEALCLPAWTREDAEAWWHRWRSLPPEERAREAPPHV